MAKQRIDQVLVDQGFFSSREQAKRAVMAGLVYTPSGRIDKPGSTVDPEVILDVRGDPLPFVSRGGLKLVKALDVFSINVANKISLDVGASTGGFTDCLLQYGASKVYAIDVGYGQLHWKLRTDPRVVVMERTNIRYVKPSDLAEKGQVATVDVAFISLTKFFKALLDLLTEDGEVVTLIKPQFEAGRELVGKKGVVRDPQVHVDVINRLIVQLQACGAGLVDLTFSPIRGPEGNVEYLAYFRKDRPHIDGFGWAERIVTAAMKTTPTAKKELGKI